MGEIALDTANLSLNRLKTERSLIGRRVYEKGANSMGELIWDYFMAGCEIKDPELAESLKKARKQRLITNLVVAAVGFTAVFQITLGEAETNRKAARMVRPPFRQFIEA